MGLVRVLEHEPATGAAKLVRSDGHLYYRYEKDRVRRVMLNPFRVTLTPDLLAPVGTKESAAYVHARAKRYLGDFRRLGFLFAMAAVGPRLAGAPPADPWVERFVRPMLAAAVARRGSSDSVSKLDNSRLLELARAVVDEGIAEAKSDYDVEVITPFIERVYAETGENLVRSGLLRAYAGEYPRGIRLSGFPPRPHVYRWSDAAGRKLKHDFWSLDWVPQDIDHFVRSVLWQKNDSIMKLRMTAAPAGDDADVLVVHPSRAPAYLAAVDEVSARTAPVAPRVTLRRSAPTDETELPPHVLGFWKRIWSTAGSLTLGEDLRGRRVLFVATGNAFVDAEVMRLLHDQGVAHVRVSPAPPAETSVNPD